MIRAILALMPPTRALLTTICAASLCLPAWSVRAAPEEGDAPLPAAPTPEAPESPPTAPSDVGGDARADDLQDAMVRAFTERFQEGKFLFNRGSYAQAAMEFERAFAAIPAEAALFNVALSYERAGDRVSAALAARKYMLLPDCGEAGVKPEMCGARRAEVQAQLERLMAQIGELRLEISKGVVLREVSINGRKVAIGDFPVLVASGRIDIELVGALAGQRRQRVIDVRPGERQAIVVGPFDRPDIVGGDGPRAREPKPRPKWLRPLFWSGVSLTAASGIAMATMGGLLIREGRLVDENLCDRDPATATKQCPDPPGDYYPHDNVRREAQYKTATNVLVGVTAGLAVITTIVGIVAFTGEDARRKRNGSTQRASTRVRWQGAGVLVHF
ncbi:MAG: hypothetical protein IAG13_11060 [Deltaproteobacteria bacterium]|nr:hypothetical protein [Nannocystaceae bacterium]